jgi:hypothetical protein
MLLLLSFLLSFYCTYIVLECATVKAPASNNSARVLAQASCTDLGGSIHLSGLPSQPQSTNIITVQLSPKKPFRTCITVPHYYTAPGMRSDITHYTVEPTRSLTTPNCACAQRPQNGHTSGTLGDGRIIRWTIRQGRRRWRTHDLAASE